MFSRFVERALKPGYDAVKGWKVLDERQLRHELNEGTIRPVYVLLGNDATRREQAFRHIRDAAVDPALHELAVQTFDGETAAVDEIVEAASTAPFLGERRVVYVRRFDAMSAEDQATVIELLAAGLPTTVLVLAVSALDRRRKAVQSLFEHAAIVQLEDPEGEGMISWLLREARVYGLRLQGQTARRLMDVAGSQVDVLRRELEKLSLYVGAGGEVTEEDVLQVAAAGSAEAEENAIFQLCDAVAEGRTAQALHKLDELLNAGANGIYVVVMLARHYRLLLAVKTCGETNPSRVSDVLNFKAPRFVVERLLSQAARLTRSQIEEGLRALLHTDMQLKRSAPVRPTIESVIVRLTERTREKTGTTYGTGSQGG